MGKEVGNEYAIHTLRVSVDEKYVVCGAEDGTVTVWSAFPPLFRKVFSARPQTGVISSCAVTVGAIYVGSFNNSVFQLDFDEELASAKTPMQELRPPE